MKFRTSTLITGTWLLALSTTFAYAQDKRGLEDKAVERLNAAQRVAPLSIDSAFGEQFSRFNGTMEFNNVDISIPGNNDLPVELRRNLRIEDRRVVSGKFLGGLWAWDLDIPHLSGVFTNIDGWTVSSGGGTTTSRCSTTAAPRDLSVVSSYDYWEGYNLHVPAQIDEPLLITPDSKIPVPNNGTSYPWITKSMWRISCKASTKNGYPGEAFIATGPDGTKYHLDWVISKPHSTLVSSLMFSNVGGQSNITIPRQVIYFLASRIEDRHGNWVDYTYSGSRLSSITSSDGRYINLSYSNNSSATATSSIGTWSYSVNGGLFEVTQPDGSKWRYNDVAGSMYIFPPASVPNRQGPTDCAEVLEANTGDFKFSITNPAGATATYDFTVLRHYRNNIPKICHYEANVHEYLQIPNYSDVFTLTAKQVAGPGLTPVTWAYSYGSGSAVGFTTQCNNPDGPLCRLTKTHEFTRSDGHYERYEFGARYDINEGQLISISIGTSSSNILKTVTNEYVSASEAATAAFPNAVGVNLLGFSDSLSSRFLRPQKKTTVVQDGVTYTRSTQVSQFDPFARPTSVDLLSNISYGYARTDATEYHDDLPKWLLGQVKRSYTGGVEVSEIEFNANSQPYRVYRYNDATPVQTLTYNTDGTLATFKDSNGNITTLSNWKRGIPQYIQHPATPESPTGSAESAVVNDAGWITSTADENGYATNYQYDAMGRVSRIVYPTSDSVTWNDKTFVFEQVNQDEYGIPAGHWRHITVQGNYKKVSLFDALWRPLWTYEHDESISDLSVTFRLTGRRFDHDGHETFASYPRNPYADGNWSIDTGVHTTYDVLGRPVLVKQNSELGDLNTITSFASGETTVTNPRNQVTRTRYAAWDQPSTDYPIEIFHPEGAVTQIWRDYFFKPTQIRRSGSYAGQTVEAVRKYYYDGLQRLCRTDEPETGSTVMGYDYNDNLTWSAAGLSGLNTVDCDHVAAYNGGRTVTRSYDARNRLSQMAFPGDGLGNQTWTYTKDGLPATITTYNGAGNTAAVVNSYGYNKRRLLTSETISEPGLYTWPLGYGYDPNGNLAAQTYPTGLALTYSPNALGQATQVSTSAGSTTAGTYATGVSYYPNGAIKQFTYGNGVLHTMSQNARQLPDTVSDIGVAGYTYTYDANGNTTQIVDNGQGANFNRYLSYDGLDRLTAAGSAMFGGSTHYINYGYDAIDNIRSVSHPGVREHSYWYNAKNQLTNVQNSGGASVVGLSYDLQGNLNNKNGQQYGFDYGNRLRWVMGKENYRYDGHGRRSKVQKDNGLQEWFQYSQAGQYLFSSKLTAGGVQTTQENVYLGGSVIATIDHNWPSNTVIATKYQHTDALGSPVATTDASGALIERTNYEPYGSAINKTVDGIGYTGHVMDGATELTYMQQRYYDPGIGRFLSADPVTVYQSGDQNYFNRYWYAGGNPYRFIDPDGRLLKIAGDAKYKQEIRRQLKELKRTPTGRAIVRAIEASKKYTIVISPTTGVSGAKPTDDQGARNGVGSHGTILHNPAYKGPANTTEGFNQPTPSHIILGHELTHGVDYVRGSLDRSWNRATKMKRSEEKSIGIENQLRREFNVPLRTGYGP